MDLDMVDPPNSSTVLSPNLNQINPNQILSEFMLKTIESEPLKPIEKEKLQLLEYLRKINEEINFAKSKKLEKISALKTELSEYNLKIASFEGEKERTEREKEETLRQLSANLYELRTKNSQIIARNKVNQMKLEELEAKNIELVNTRQHYINLTHAYENDLLLIEAEDIKAKNQLSDLNERDHIYSIITQSYEEAFYSYQQKRAAAYQEIKRLNNCLQELKGNIRVFCKMRPYLPEDKSDPLRLELTEKSITLYKADKPSKFNFDRVFGPNTLIDEVFEEISQLVQSALDGYKVCIFAYGQTGSGKTYTMEGSNDNKSKGIIQKSVELMFAVAEKLKAIGWTYSFHASTIEIYNEQVRDLLDNSKVLTGVSSSVINPISIEIKSYQELVPLLITARKVRAEGETQCNAHSSRSHFLFKLQIIGKKDGEVTNGVLNLIDLAGSERLKASKAEGERLEETKAINKSLCALGDVIHALIKKEKHVPYRNSRLTYILKNCLGGDGKTLMFVNISPLVGNLKETLNSLVFAHKVNACSLN